MADYHGVLVYGETSGGSLLQISREILGCGRRIADTLGQPLSAVLIGNQTPDTVQETISYGAERVYVAEGQVFERYHTEAYTTALEKAIRAALPRIVLLGQTAIGADVAPLLAFRRLTA